MSLEDGIADVIGKAIRGQGFDAGAVAHRCGVSESEIGMEMDEIVIRKFAEELGLDGDALVGLKNYTPEERAVEGVTRVVMPFREWTVNAWLIEKAGRRILFDTGMGESDVEDRIDCSGMECVFITHGHVDHVGGIAALKERRVRVVREDEALVEGCFEFGDVKIRAVDLSGHCDPAVGYVVSGFGPDLLVAGDAVFAGSAGGWKTVDSYHKAFKTMKAVFAGLDAGALILPGHGPMTTLGEEFVANPFRLLFS